MNKTLKSISIRAANIVLNVTSETDLNLFSDLDFYKKFRIKTDFIPHCRLNLKIGSFPDIKLEGRVFNPAGNWRLLKSDTSNVLQLDFSGKTGIYEDVTVFNSDYSEGVIYRKNIFELFRRFLDQFIFANLLSRRRGFLLHSSGVIWRGKGLVFSGRSGVGKSTLIKLFSSHVKKQDLLSDDRLVVRKYRNKWRIYGTPWYGEVPISSSGSANLKALFFIQHSKKNFIRRLSSSNAFQRLIVNSLFPFWDEIEASLLLDSFTGFVQEIPVFELGFVPDGKIIDMIKEVA